MAQGKYVEHHAEEASGFSVVDATTTEGARPHDGLVWVGYGGEGRWLTGVEALNLAQAIERVVASQQARMAREAGPVLVDPTSDE
jgi:hypothetical protein